MEHKFINSGRINLIVSDLERYNVGLLESEINFDSGSDEPRYPVSSNFHHISWQEELIWVIYFIYNMPRYFQAYLEVP
jgi:hypothetical protein